MIQTIPTTKAGAVALITAHLEQRTDDKPDGRDRRNSPSVLAEANRRGRIFIPARIA
jgi:hypothetical protein